ncbi:hypothetical protein BDN71DRAFT_643778 [Pleurotus eryngii]|uniref:DUF7330 domain-containing protein n=1 Tax=Pleurotus eryngii TaxID=5323 RepID=A0A9P6A2S5_PLEER|nr:hypothetical protein BDN71DRAFT_643778 [Pleurotus eryngii]
MILEARSSVLVRKYDEPKAQDPPPYSDVEPSLAPPPSLFVRSADSDCAPVNGLHLQKRKEDITGSYWVDPCLPASDTHRPPKGWRAPPNISFETHQGAINVELSTACLHEGRAKSIARVSSHTGDITVTLADAQPDQTINVDMSSRRGTVALFIPRNFSGVVQLTTRRGSMQLLPGLLKIAKIVNETETETLLMIANPRTTTSSSTANYCQLYSRFGKLYVGVKGEDKLLPKEPGKWAKFAQYLVLFHSICGLCILSWPCVSEAVTRPRLSKHRLLREG